MSNSLWSQGLQHARLSCPSPNSGTYSNSCPLSWWCHSTISSSVVPFSSCFQSFPASGSFPMSQLFASGGQSIGVSASASVLPMNIQDWLPLGWTGWISLQSKGVSTDFLIQLSLMTQFEFVSFLPGIWLRKRKETLKIRTQNLRTNSQMKLHEIFVTLCKLFSLS